jgi:cohesin complex subunit SA-1/2
MTRVLINALPKLFAKNKTDEGRIADIVLIPQVMNLDLYLEMRMITVSRTLIYLSMVSKCRVY